jgi:hypothetical protein
VLAVCVVSTILLEGDEGDEGRGFKTQQATAKLGVNQQDFSITSIRQSFAIGSR